MTARLPAATATATAEPGTAIRPSAFRRQLGLIGRAVIEVLPAWLVARVLVGGGLVAAHLVVHSVRPGNPTARLRVHDGLLGWDAGWYRAIASHGYATSGHQSLRFFPLYPMLGRSIGHVPGIGVGTALIVVANVASLLAMAGLLLLVRHDRGGMPAGEGGLGRRSVWLLALAPSAFALVLAYADAVLLLCVVVAFLGFRNNASYDRFWEGRKLWGGLVNTSRSLARQSLTLIDGPVEGPRELVRLVIAYAHALRHHLRGTSPVAELEGILGADETAAIARQDNVPYALLQRMGERIVEARRKEQIHPFHVPVLESSLTSLTDIQGACERIKSTPLPYSYTVLMHRIVAGYCVLLPFGLMDIIDWATPFVVLAISYCFFGLDAIGDELEQPFGTDVNDLPLDGISRTIERNLRERLGEALPPAVAPIRGILS